MLPWRTRPAMAGWCHLPGPHSMNVHTGLTALTAPQQDPKGAQCTTTRTQTIPLDDPIPPQGSMDLGELALGPAAAQPHALGPAKALSKAAVARSLHLWDNQDPRPSPSPQGSPCDHLLSLPQVWGCSLEARSPEYFMVLLETQTLPWMALT